MTGFTSIDPEAESKVVKLQRAVVHLEKAIQIEEERMIPLQRQLARSLESKMLGLYKWDGPWSSAGHTKVHEPNEMLITGAACAASPFGMHVVSRIMALPNGAYVKEKRAVCFCCREKLIYTSEQFGWQTSKERSSYTSAVRMLKELSRDTWNNAKERETDIRKAMAAIDACTSREHHTLLWAVDDAFTMKEE